MRRRRRRYPRPAGSWSRGILLALTLGWWLILIGLILLTEPVRLRDVIFTGLYFPFLLLLFLALSGTLILIRQRFWPSLIWTAAVSLFLILRLYGWGNIINLAMIASCLIILEVYWRQTEKTKRQAVTAPPELKIN
ncbi:hypothetical protein A2W24_01500 [Microgenomates group bacterium RBG_16_45_19]|nr:MAG: hypothetical protein A2W24_01500 [Microgenomates group bacterium RBG_16_45_19]